MLGAVRTYLDDRAWRRLQPPLPFDNANLRCVSDIDLASAMNDPVIGAAFAEDHAGIAGAFGGREMAGGVNPGDGRALYHLVGYFKPRRVLEIGTHVGASTVHIASSLHRFVDQGSLCTADISDVNGPEGAWQSSGMRRPPSGIMSDLGLKPIVSLSSSPRPQCWSLPVSAST
jgi:hypothetical protein